MEKTEIKSNEMLSCGCCSQSRRTFLSNCVKCVGAVGAFSGFIVPSMLAAESNVLKQKSDTKVRVVFILWEPLQTRATWPNAGFDFNPVMEKILNSLSAGCPRIEFAQSMVSSPEEAKKVIESDQAEGKIEGYLVLQLNNWTEGIKQVVESGKPVLYADFLYAGSGGFLTRTAGHIRSKADNFAHMSSGNFAHVVAAVNCFPLAKEGGNKAFVDGVKKIRQKITASVKVNNKCLEDKLDLLSIEDLLKELKTKKVIAFEGESSIRESTKATLGIEIIPLKFAELNELWEKADKDQAMGIVRRWKSSAVGIEDVSDETLEKSARMYLAMKQCLKNHDACAVTINCLGGFYGGQIQAYPCLGFHELLNEGLIGACECDMVSTVTEVVMTTLTKGRPGFISDPVMDVATRQIIYAHCVASNRPFGPKGPVNPFTIMTHSEDRKGASLRSTLPVGYMTTTLEMHPTRKEILFHQAKAVDNSTEDRACRTKLATVPVGDFEKLYTEWDRWGWHRVTFYGDLKNPVFALADKLGWKVVEET